MLFNSAEPDRERQGFRVSEKTTIKAMIVHDNPLTRMGLRSALSNSPDISIIAEAGTREEAIAAIHNSQLDIVLVDPATANRLFSTGTIDAHITPTNGNGHTDARRSTAHGSSITSREMEVLHLVVKGYTNQAIANELIISLATAKAHVRSIFTKLAVEDRTQAAVEAMRRGLV
jgi:DNA-binding NarL/FixJ family response regulator